MLKAIYINNYKGFKNANITFNKCNLFVGENSSGKTSIIELIRNVIPNRYPTFNNTEWENTPYKALHTIGNNEHMQVAFNLGSDDRNRLTYYEISERNEYPLVYKATFQITDKYFLHIKHTEKRFNYFFERKELDPNDLKSAVDYFSSDFKYKNKNEIALERRYVLPFSMIEFLQKKIEDEDTIDNIFINFYMEYNYKYTGPIRYIPDGFEYKTKNDYDSQGKDLLPRFLELTSNSKRNKTKINSFGKRSSLFDKFDYKKINNKSFYIAMISTITKNNIELPVKYNGTGISQVLPIIMDLYTIDDLLISQPELHLHPQAQFELGKEIFNSLFYTNNRQFFIETHSDYIIDSIREEELIFDIVNTYCSKNTCKLYKEAEIVDNEMVKKVEDYILANYNLENHKNLSNSVIRSLFLVEQNYNKISLSINFFKDEKNVKKVFNIGINKDGSYNGENIKIFRDFYLNYSSRGLNL